MASPGLIQMSPDGTFYPGVLKFGFGRDVPPRNLKEKVTYSYTNRPNVWSKFEHSCPKFPNFFIKSQFWLKFGKILKNLLIHIPKSAVHKGSFIYQEADFATRDGGTSP